MIIKATAKAIQLIALILTISLLGCGGGAETNTDPGKVDPSLPVSDWKLVWVDDFDGDTINSRNWTHEVNCSGGGNNEKQCYTDNSANSYVQDGILNIVAMPADEGAEKPYTSARINSRYKADFKYGRIEINAKLPSGQGAWPAFWMMPTDEVYGGWPKSGEIDILEAVNLKTADADGNIENNIYGTLHYGKEWPDNSSSGKAYSLPDGINPADDFHTYAIEWQEGEIRWYIDDYLYQTQRASKVLYNSKGEAAGLSHRGWYAEYYDAITGELVPHYTSAPFDQNFYIILNLAVGGDWPENVNNLGVDVSALENGQTFEVDYVRVYECSIDPITGAGCETVRAGYESFEDALVEGLAPIPSAGVAQKLVVFRNEANPFWPLWDCCGNTTPQVVIDDEEHGATAEFLINGETVVGFDSREAGTPFDASAMVAIGSVSFDMKVITPTANASTDWKFKIESNGTAAEVSLTSSKEGLAPVTGEWQTYTFSLQALADAGLNDASAIDVLMIFPTWGEGNGAEFRVDNFEISPDLVIFEEIENPLWQAWDCCGGSLPTFETDDAEHGLTTEFVIGAAPTVMGFTSRVENGVPFDGSTMLTTGSISFEMKVVSPPSDSSSTWMFKVESNGGDTAVEIPLSASTPITGDWQTYSFSLQSLADAGLDVSGIDVLMIFPAWNTGNGAVYRVDNVRIALQELVLFNDAENPLWQAWDCCGGSLPTFETDDAEHGLTTEFVIGAAPTVMGYTSREEAHGVIGGMPFDASSLVQSGAIQFEMKVVNAPINPGSSWMFKVESGGGPNAGGTAVELPISASSQGVEPVSGVWQTYTFTLKDLVDAGLDPSAIDVVMIFPAWDTGNGAVYRVDNAIIGIP